MPPPIPRKPLPPAPRSVVPTVKVCGLTRPEDIAGCLAQHVDYLGVNRHPTSPRFVHDDAVRPLLERIPNGKRVYVAVAPDLPGLATADRQGFDFFQIHFDPLHVPEKRIRTWAECVGRDRLWLAPRLAGGVTFPVDLIPLCAAFLIDGYSPESFGGTGKTADWAGAAALKSVHPERRWIIAGGLKPENILDAAKISHADILDLNSGIEDAPGLKSMDKLRLALANLQSGYRDKTNPAPTPASGVKPPPPAKPENKLRL